MRSPLASLIPGTALSFVGRHEFPLGSNRGPQIQEFFDSDDYDPNGKTPGDQGYAWCASLVCRIVQLAMLKAGGEYTFKRPTTAGAWDLERWSLKQDNSTRTRKLPGRDIKAGDIVVFKISHVGIAVTDADKNGDFDCVQGNSNNGGSREGTHVVNKRINCSKIRSRIRFTV